MNTIPLMTHPDGAYWRQPSAADILLDDTHALMSMATLAQLAHYDTSTPSGVYDGKMWACDRRLWAPDGELYLCSFAPSASPSACRIERRIILLP